MSDTPSDLVRVRMSVVLSPELTLTIDREHGHFQAVIGRWMVSTDGFGNLVVSAYPVDLSAGQPGPILKVRAAE